ncbi:hypothetical protein Q3G72_005769 [Acer saccharum]|nr:hypothetical protein Q3G72_005769 [Acer saccharum]
MTNPFVSVVDMPFTLGCKVCVRYHNNQKLSITGNDLKFPDTDESTKEDLVQRRLWEKSNLESYMAEMRKESKRRR